MTRKSGNDASHSADVEQRDLGRDLERFLFGEKLSAEEVAELTSLAQYEQYSPGQVILAEGTTNDRVFFLIEGAISVTRAGERIATLSTPGDVLGEMSLITKGKCSASNVAECPSSLLVLQVEKVIHLSPKIQSVFSHALTRLFSVILAKKLALTNEKARLFEIANRELEYAKKALEAASTNKIDELTVNQWMVFKRVQRILENEAEPVRVQLDLLAAKNTHDSGEIQELASRVQRIFSELEPLTKTMESEGQLRNKRVLLAEDNIDEQINAKMSLIGTGVELRVVGDLESAKAALQTEKFDIICVGSAFVDLIPVAGSLGQAAKYVFVTSEPVSKHFETLQRYPILSTILARHPSDRVFNVKNLSTTIRKLSGTDIFGMEKYLSWGTEVTEHTVTGNKQRAELVGKMEEYLDSIDVSGPLRSKAARVAEELLMNAIYDAPADKSGKPLYNHLDRTVAVNLKPEEYSRFRYACDGTLLAISVVDPFGMLTRETILKYLERCLGDAPMDMSIPGKGGGGNGLFQIIRSSSLTVFNVRPKQRTEVIALLNLNYQIQKISLHPSFHYFELGA